MKLFILLIASWVAAADEPTAKPIETERVIYSSQIGNHFEAYLDALKRGYPIGTVVKRGEDSNDTDMAKIAQGLEAEGNRIQQALVKSLEESAVGIQLAGTVSPVETVSSEAPKLQAPSLWEAKRLPELVQCAGESLPLLKKLLLARAGGFSLSQNELEGKLFASYGSGNTPSIKMVCAKSFAEYGLLLPDPVENVKLLLPFSLIAQEKLVDLFSRYSLYADALKRKDSYSPGFWDYVWKRSSSSVVFSKRLLPSLDALQAEFRKLSTRTSALEFKSGTVPVRETLPKDWEARTRAAYQKRLKQIEGAE